MGKSSKESFKHAGGASGNEAIRTTVGVAVKAFVTMAQICGSIPVSMDIDIPPGAFSELVRLYLYSSY